jgi:hydrogenase expression/formation protein HypC
MKKTVTTRLLGELQPGDFVTVHADIAYGRISREEYDTAKVLWKKLAKCS